MQPIPLPADLVQLAARVRSAGGRAFLVGGCVRDHLMGRPLYDWDVEVHGLEIDALGRALRTLGNVNQVGRSFGVFKLRPPRWKGPEIDVSIPRRDSKVGPGHRGIAVEGDPGMSIFEAARRRDLTVNAILYDLSEQTLVDPHGGVADLSAGLLRAVDADTFLEDPLRALRVAQFAARLGFEVDPGLVDLGRMAALDELPAERVFAEWLKLLVDGHQPSRGWDYARDAGILERVFPEAPDVVGTARLLDELVPARDALDPVGRRLALMLGGWLRDGSPAAVVATLERLGLHKYLGYDVRTAAQALVRHHRAGLETDADLRRLSTHAEVQLVLGLRGALEPSLDVGEHWAHAAALGVLCEPPPPLLQGRDLPALGIAPGPQMGVILREVYQAQLDGSVTTKEEALDAAARRASD